MTTVQDLIDRLEAEAAADADPETTPDVGIIMGSDSDLPTMEGRTTRSTSSGSPSRPTSTTRPTRGSPTRATSSPRTGRRSSCTRTGRPGGPGLDIVIAGAGGKSADLPNMTASLAYPIPVIGVPVQEKSVDSVIGMPTGAPIVAVDAGKSFNAGLSAAQVLAREHDAIEERLIEYHEELKGGVAEVSADLHDLGIDGFRDRNEP